MTELVINDVFSKLCKVSGFKYSEKKLYYYLNKSNFQEKIDKYEQELNVSPYTIFIKEQLDKGVKLNDVLDLWSKIKKNKSKLKVYEDKYNEHLNQYDKQFIDCIDNNGSL
tara:strand:- start:475 stop:807 length:333 start_codon:yes stop_codon:yes gene_type:complete